jgi:hypothetical protein
MLVPVAARIPAQRGFGITMRRLTVSSAQRLKRHKLIFWLTDLHYPINKGRDRRKILMSLQEASVVLLNLSVLGAFHLDGRFQLEKRIGYLIGTSHAAAGIGRK